MLSASRWQRAEQGVWLRTAAGEISRSFASACAAASAALAFFSSAAAAAASALLAACSA